LGSSPAAGRAAGQGHRRAEQQEEEGAADDRTDRFDPSQSATRRSLGCPSARRFSVVAVNDVLAIRDVVLENRR
jgi:hypothetical protein